MLLRAIDDEASLGVGDETATRVLRTGGAVVHQGQVAAGDVHPPHRRGLRDRPEVTRGITAGLPHDVDCQVRQRAPEVDQRDTVVGGQTLVVDVDVAVDGDVGRRGTQASHFGIVAHLNDERLGSAAVGTRLEQECISFGSKLVTYLLCCHLVHRRLDLTGRHAGIEDQHVQAEVGWDEAGEAAAALTDDTDSALRDNAKIKNTLNI